MQTVRNLIKRNLLKESFEESRDFLRSVTENSPNYIMTIDKDGFIKFINKNLFDLSKEQVIDTPVYSHVSEEYGSVMKECFERVLSTGKPDRFETEYRTADGDIRIFESHVGPVKTSGGITAVTMCVSDITEHIRSEIELARQNKLLNAINRISERALSCDSLWELGKACLQVCEELTESKFGFVGEINSNGLFDTIAISNPGWSECGITGTNKVRSIRNMKIRGIWGSSIKKGTSQIVNDPASHPDRIGTPESHPDITSFLGVPLKEAGKTIGLIALANKESSYRPIDQENVEIVSATIVDALRRKQAEEDFRQSKEKLALRDSIAQIFLTLPNERIYEEILKILLKDLKSECGTFGHFNENGSLVCLSMIGGIHKKYRVCEKGFVSSPGTWGGLWSQALTEKSALYSNEGFRVPDGHIPISRTLYAPIIYQGELIGDLFLGNKETDYTERDKTLLATIAGYIAPILNARLQKEKEEKERKQSEEKLEESNEKLRNLTQRLESIREEERTRIAREIHDDLGQALTALKMNITWLRDKLARDNPTLLEKVVSMSEWIDNTLKSVQKISSELRPTLLDHLGLTTAIDWQIREFQKRYGIRCNLNVEPETIILDKERSISLFRILQETLTNVIRHANATKVEVSVFKKDNKIVLKAKDNGRGITQAQISHPESLGLLGIQERVKYWGGKIDINGIPGKGTTVGVYIPFDGKKQLK